MDAMPKRACYYPLIIPGSLARQSFNASAIAVHMIRRYYTRQGGEFMSQGAFDFHSVRKIYLLASQTSGRLER